MTRANDEIVSSLYVSPAYVPGLPEPRVQDGGVILTMRDGAQWFHPYNGGAPVRLPEEI
jgi:hypothetical protein